MAIKASYHVIKGMQKDLSLSKFNPEFCFDAQNIRITARENDTLLAVTNEKGNKEVGEVEGTPLGTCVVGSEVIIFTHGDKDYIYKLTKNPLTITLLYSGALNFSLDNPIQTLGFIENNNARKVYWVDGLNNIRSLNIANWDNGKTPTLGDSPFEFVKNLALNEKVSVQKSFDFGGMFPSGVVQYALTYFNLYEGETNVFYTSPINYIAFEDRGGSPEEVVSNVFNIAVQFADPQFEYIRIYSILRTSIDATPTVKQLADVKIGNVNITVATSSAIIQRATPLDGIDSMKAYVDGVEVSITTTAVEHTVNNNFTLKGSMHQKIGNTDYYYNNLSTTERNDYPLKIQLHYDQATNEVVVYDPTDSFIADFSNDSRGITYIDNNTTGLVIDPTELIYKGGESVAAGTITQKDNTMFLGDLKLSRPKVPQSLKDLLRSNNKDYIPQKISFTHQRQYVNPLTGDYPYTNQLRYDSSKITTLKSREVYRFGIQGQYKSGRWSEPIFLEDCRVNIVPKIDNWIDYIVAQYVLSDQNVLSQLASLGFRRVRGVIVYPSESDRDIILQGIACPTVFNVGDRQSGLPFAQSSWFFRPNQPVRVEPSNPASGANVDFGSYVEFRDGYPLPNNIDRSAELQTSTDVVDMINSGITNTPYSFIVDRSIITLHSPELELEQITSNSINNCEFRIVGQVPLTGNMTDVDITTTTPPMSNEPDSTSAPGFWKPNVGTTNENISGWRILNNYPLWRDKFYDEKTSTPQLYGFVTYPWHRNGSLNNSRDNSQQPAWLGKKKMSNLRFATKTKYFNVIPTYLTTGSGITSQPVEFDGQIKISDTGVQVFRGNEITPVYIEDTTGSRRSYYGNVDKVVSVGDKTYPIIHAGTGGVGSYRAVDGDDVRDLKNAVGNDPVRMKYKSTPHGVFSFSGYNWGHDSRLNLPLGSYGNAVNANNVYLYGNPFWDNNFVESVNLMIDLGDSRLGDVDIEHGYMWLVELYRETTNKFGGTSEDALTNNTWIPAGDSVALYDASNNLKTSVTIPYTIGDTYIQRFDSMKTYPFTQEDQNQIVEIMSFFCETRLNIDGRYDRNRGSRNNLNMTPQNFNLMNKVYNQRNTFFPQVYVDAAIFNIDSFPNTITWSKTKLSGETTDSWANLNVSSTLDMDGDKGRVTSLVMFNNDLLCLQESGFAKILYNTRTQISTSDNIPIELGNSGKVDGKYYISNNTGSGNRGSVAEVPEGIYFIDGNVKSIFFFNGQLNNLTDTLGFHSWASTRLDNTGYKPSDFKGFKAFYDPVNKDIYYSNKDVCICYSELLRQFVSFYSYEETPEMIGLQGDLYTLHKDDSKQDSKYKLWHQWAGDYNIIHGKFRPYSVTVVSNQDEPYDKIFNNLEFRADSWNGDTLLQTTFDTLKVENEYQVGTADLKFIKALSSNLKRKFRIWRAFIPRDDSNRRDRMRNTWLKIQLAMNKPNTWRTELHDMTCWYYM